MELWEFNNCVSAFNEKQKERSRESLVQAWQIANFVGAAFSGKLRDPAYYLEESQVSTAPKISKDEFEEKLKRAQEAMNIGN